MVTLLELQNQQLEHDKECHRDIFFMSYQERFKHIAMHYGKYSGRLADILRGDASSPESKEKLRKTLVDAFIIVLNSAEMLQMNLEYSLKNKLGIKSNSSIAKLSDALVESSPDLFSILNAPEDRERTLNLLLELTSIGGFMQKVGEELDHMVGIPRDELRAQTLNLLTILLLAAKIWKVDFGLAVPKRWKEIQQKTSIRPQ